LGEEYNPQEHWTSKRRTLAGHSHLPFEGPYPNKATFTIDDKTSTLTQYLTNFTDSAESWLTKPPIYHLEVKTTKGGLGDEIAMSSNEFERVSRLLLQFWSRINANVGSTI
jgi:hypothetical protein